MVDAELQGWSAVTGKAPVVRRFPMIAGIDFAGTVEQSRIRSGRPRQGRLDGWGMGETIGGFAERRASRAIGWCGWLTVFHRDAMAIGIAGYTAMSSVLALEKHGPTPKSGPIVDLRRRRRRPGRHRRAFKLGYHVIASAAGCRKPTIRRALAPPR